MSQGYDQFFKKAKASKNGASGGGAKVTSKHQRSFKATPTAKTNVQSAEDFLREAIAVKDRNQKRKPKFPIAAFAVVILGFAGAATGYFYPEKVRAIYENYSLGLFGEAGAATNESTPPNPNATEADRRTGENSAAPTAADAAKTAGAPEAKTKGDCADSKGFSEEELSHFNKLNDRKKELDLREQELTALEEELHKQKSEVESRIAKLEQIREEVATTLKDRVEVDQQRVNTLVDFYSNMKPKQAADVFAKLNEDLAVEVLGKMKKKNAADILNLLDPTKARTLSEKFTGYKRD